MVKIVECNFVAQLFSNRFKTLRFYYRGVYPHPLQILLHLCIAVAAQRLNECKNRLAFFDV